MNEALVTTSSPAADATLHYARPSNDEHQLNLLSTLWLVWACLGLTVNLLSYRLFYILPQVILGLFKYHWPILASVLCFFFLSYILCWIANLLAFLTAIGLHRRRHRLVCIVNASLILPGIPFGLLLGLFTLSVLRRPSVHELFEGARTSAAPPTPFPVV